MNSLVLLLGLLCHLLPLMCKYAAAPKDLMKGSVLELSRASSIVMFVAYVAYLVFQLKDSSPVVSITRGVPIMPTKEKVCGFSN